MYLSLIYFSILALIVDINCWL